jgi:GT2 family glycosyltransferase
VSRVLYAIPTLGGRDEWLRLSIGSVQRQIADVRTVVVAPAKSSAWPVATSMGVEYLPSERPGLSAAVNDVWKTFGADYDYFAWIADDDVLSPISLLATTDYLDHHPRCVAVYGRDRLIGADGASLQTSRPGRLAGVLLPYGTQQVTQPGSLFRATAIRQVGFLDEHLVYSMDYDLFLKLRRVGSLDYLPLELAAIRTHSDRITDNRGDNGRELITVRERSLTPRQAAVSRYLLRGTRVVDLVYGSAIRRMGQPPEPAVRLGAHEYVHSKSASHVPPVGAAQTTTWIGMEQ